MDRQVLTAKANELIALHLTNAAVGPKPGWTFKLNDDKSRCGVCRYAPKSIELSVYHVDNAPDAQVLNTLLHEIAHAKAGHDAGHGWMWRLVARQIGCDGARCVSHANSGMTASVTNPKYIGTCAKCGVEIPKHKRSKVMSSTTAYHSACGKTGTITWRQVR